MEPIILASGSLRRQEYFRLMSLPFSIMPSNISESYTGKRNPQQITKELASRKVKRILEQLQGRSPPWICGADTAIALDGAILGKPSSRDDAAAMLKKLQGRDHEVVTAVALYNGREKKTDCRCVASTVSFAPLSPDDIEWYLNTGEWQEAAGSYKIQGLASCFITGIKGSYSGIVGLPLREFYVMLRDNGYPYA
ncbi:MAG: Maf family protein [Treponema sp.]|nr:Maf family protein [Treponema sp.]